MANNMVKFQRGTQAIYDATYWSDYTFYYTTDTKNFYIGNTKLSNAADLAAAVERLGIVEQGLTAFDQGMAQFAGKLYGDETVPESIKAIVASYVNPVKEDLGNVDNLSTTNKTVVGAINEVLAAVGTGGTAAVVTMTESASDDYAKVYTLKQGTTNIGTINIPKDMVVKSGTIEVNPAGQAEGTYIVLTLANATEDKIYVNVGTLVDIYKAAGNANQVQVAIDSATREISATIVAGSITATELADNAVVTAKIADANVTKAKLAANVQASLDKADTAMQQANLDTLKTDLEGQIATAKTEAATDAKNKADAAQAAAATDAQTKADAALASAKTYADTKAGEGLKTTDFTTGATNGTFKVKDTEVVIKGLGSAAYTDAGAYDGAGMAAAAETNAKAYADELAEGINEEISDINQDLTDLDNQDATNLQAAKDYTDTEVNKAKSYADQQIEAAVLVWEDIFQNVG